MNKHFPFLFMIFLFSLVGMKALFHPGLFTAHDIWHQVARFYHYYQALIDGQFPPYWITTLANGFGYPLFFFSYHLPWITGIPFLTLGFDIPTTIKILFFMSYLFSGIFMYLFVFDLFKSKFAALLSSILYMWAPYHFLTILVSAAMGQAFVFMFLPLVLWGIYKQSVPLTALGLAGSMLSHLMTVVSLFPLITLFIIRAGNLKKTMPGVLLGMGLSAFYLIPAVYYSQFTQVSTGVFAALYQKQFVNLNQLIYSKWGYGISDNAKEAIISYQVGIAQWLSFVMAIFFFRGLARLLTVIFLLSIFLMTPLSRPLWDLVARITTLDYPTMFLLSATFVG